MQFSILAPFGARRFGLMLSLGVLFLSQSDAILANPAVSGATAQISPNPTNDQFSPANIVTGPDFRTLMKIMRRNIVACGGPRTAVLHWHVTADGVIDNFILNKSSGDVCFDEIVILNAEEVVKAKLHITPATRFGIAEAAWVPFSVVARD
jgi:hypothetical protein